MITGKSDKCDRREFISTSAAAFAGISIPFADLHLPDEVKPPGKRFPVRLFSKPIDEYDFGFMCECLRNCQSISEVYKKTYGISGKCTTFLISVAQYVFPASSNSIMWP